MGDKYRQNHAIKNVKEIIDSIKSNNNNINDLIKNRDLLKLLNTKTHFSRREVVDLLVSFNAFKDNENSLSSKTELFINILNSDFISETLEPIFRQYFLNIPPKDEIKVMIRFLSNCIELLPSQFIVKMALLYPCVHFVSQQFTDTEIKEQIKSLEDFLTIAKNKIENRKSAVTKTSDFIDDRVSDFRQFSVFPTPSDIFCTNEDVRLRRNKYAGENKDKDNIYDSVDDYLDTQFCLLKEDFVRPLRDGISEIRETMFKKSNLEMRKLQIRLYENTIIEDMFTSQTGLVYNVKFDVTKLKRVDWKKGRRFIYGSLLCFTNNLFETIYFASVVDSDPKKLEKGNLVVEFKDDPIMEVLDNNQFLMIETKNLFEAYKHVLQKLKTFSVDTLPFKDFLVFGKNIKESPAYMNIMDLKLIDKEGAMNRDFDESQNVAFVNALKSSLSLIQGPPGTGKTYVGLKMIKYLVTNFRTINRDIGPILVVCYTNHALDQFLSDIIEAIGVENVIRVGGRSKIEIMKECNMNTIKSKWIKRKAFSSFISKRLIQNRQAIEVATENLIRKYANIMNYDNEIYSFGDLDCCMTYNHIDYFHKYSFDIWIKGGDSLLGKFNKKISNLKNNLIQEQFDICVERIISEVLIRILYDGDVFEVEEEYEMAEDPDNVLFNQNFLDEDVDLLKYGNKFQNIYMTHTYNEEVSNEDGFKYVANKKLIRNKLKTTKPLTEEEYNSLIDLDVDFDVRLRLYRYWLEKYKIILNERYKIEKSKFDILNKEKEEILFEEYIAILKSVKVIGMTTTGAARYGSVLDRVGCRVVVIEEAAEVLESHVVSSLSKHCEHLIMIGDHKQLKPKVNVYDLEMNYDFGISLFERLIANDCQYFTLQFQHRMRPDISKCVMPIYPNLKDSPNVYEYSSVAGMKANLYFIKHNQYEKESIESSYKNDFEAEYVVKLCEYLIKCGNLPKHITVLTLYVGQLYNISNKMREPRFKGIRICVVDNFQGEENEIIILSLVRSNDIGKVGFVNSPNRLCVAISRAKRGFYAIGNFSFLCRKIKLLDDIIKGKLQKIEIGNKLPLECLMHPYENNYFITKIDDFSKKGCPAKCNLKLLCGHLCNLWCHRETPSHSGYKCEMSCEMICARNLHKCQLLCFEKCKCEENMTITLPCNHEKQIICFQSDIKCTEICEKKLNCGHNCVRMCYEKCICEINVTKVLNCGHNLNTKCCIDISETECLQTCYKVLNCEHFCKEKCWQNCKCKEMIEKTLPCFHKHNLLCGSDILNVRCKINLVKDFRCGHTINYECYEKLDTCMKEITKDLSCGHSVKVICGDLTEDVVCTFRCGTKLSCHHKCQGKCEECYKGQLHVECKERCRKLLKCSHYCEVYCHSGYCPPCKKPCTKYCMHSLCKGTCGEVCECNVCEINCNKQIKCIECRQSVKCSQFCGQACSTLCKGCEEKKYIKDEVYYVMKPCNCYVLKNYFQPELKFLNGELSLACQFCHKYLRAPYVGVVLMNFKKEYSILFQNVEEETISMWNELFKELKNFNYLNIDFDNIIKNIETIKVCKNDKYIFESSYKYYQQFLNICKVMTTTDCENSMRKYYKDMQKTLSLIIKWLNPFVRSFESEDKIFLDLEKAKIDICLDLLSYLNKISVADYALVHKECFSFINEVKDALSIEEIEILTEKIKEVKRNTQNKKQSTEEEEELVDRIINTKDIYKEFRLDKLSVEDKLKEIKKLIVRCHPDKNKSSKANEAVVKLIKNKQRLENV